MFPKCDHGENCGRGGKGHRRVLCDSNTLRTLDCHDFDTTCLLSSDWELDALAGLDSGLDGGVDGVGEEGHRNGEDEAEEGSKLG